MSKNLFDNAVKLAAKYPNTFQLPNALLILKRADDIANIVFLKISSLDKFF